MREPVLPTAQGPTYAHRILDATSRFASKSALRWKENGSWTRLHFSKLREAVLDLAAGFRIYGIRSGDRVALWFETSSAWVISDFALQILGAVTVTIYHTLPVPQATGILVDSGAKALISSQRRLKFFEDWEGDDREKWLEIAMDAGPLGIPWEKVKEEGAQARRNDPAGFQDLLNPSVKPDDLSAIVYTSGTTGEPKGAMLSHRNILSNADGTVACFKWLENNVCLLHLPLAHVMARNTATAYNLFTGSELALAEPEREKLPMNLKEVAPHLFITVPYLLDKFMGRVLEVFAHKGKITQTLLKRALKIGRERRLKAIDPNGIVRPARLGLEGKLYDWFLLRKIREILGGNIRYITIGGSNSTRETVEFFWGIGIPIYEGYGSTEVTNCATFTWHGGMKLGTVGRAAPDMDVRLAEDREVLIRGPNVMQGYWNRPEATKEVLDQEGWFHSGDIGEMDHEGYLKIVDRKKEIFALSTGKKVAPQEVENTLKRSAYVISVCTIGDNRRYMTALIVPDLKVIQRRLSLSQLPSIQSSEVREFMRNQVQQAMEGLADFQQIKRFLLLEEPFTIENDLMTPTLKLRRKPILERYSREIEMLYGTDTKSVISL